MFHPEVRHRRQNWLPGKLLGRGGEMKKVILK
jgi:hypothetical protein